MGAYTDIEKSASLALIAVEDLGNHETHNIMSAVDSSGQLGNSLQLSTRIDIDNNVSIGCAGAVLTYLQRRRAMGSLPGMASCNTAFRISALEIFSTKDTM